MPGSRLDTGSGRQSVNKQLSPGLAQQYPGVTLTVVGCLDLGRFKKFTDGQISLFENKDIKSVVIADSNIGLTLATCEIMATAPALFFKKQGPAKAGISPKRVRISGNGINSHA